MKILFLLFSIGILIYLNIGNESPHGSDFKISCNKCHSTNGWKIDKSTYSFDHNSTSFPLTGEHKNLNCRLCHPSLVFKDAENECISCHTDQHQGTVGMDCSRCHNTSSWLVNHITDIHRNSRFPLLGMHATADCIECHLSESMVRFDAKGIECVDCHRSDYLSTTSPNHRESGISEDCIQCHSLNAIRWAGGEFNHDFFPLQLGHSKVNCSECHADNKYSGLSSECYSCHQGNFVATINPNHINSNFSTTCTDCHTLKPGWKPAAYDHSVFPLQLGHSTPACIDCHKNGNYTNTSSDCYSCHQENYVATVNPNHIDSNFPINCSDCHSLKPGWKPAAYDHSVFPLTLGHSTPACIDCHKDGNYTNTSSECYSCHEGTYNVATNPVHNGSGFAHSCTDCHTTNPGWTPASYNHLNFPLTRGHQGVSCAECHNGNYVNTSTNCYSCHQSDYNETVNPNHKNLNFSTTCTSCHTTNPGWTPASFNHLNFPLTLGHQGVACVDCHKGNYVSTSTNCYSCHQSDYNETVNPSHKNLNFSTTCTSCHTTNPGWKPASYLQHDTQFPIYSGKHNGTWSSCSECHTNLSNYAVFSCLNCHEHNKTEMDDVHSGRSGYSYNSIACFNCHPNGRSK